MGHFRSLARRFLALALAAVPCFAIATQGRCEPVVGSQGFLSVAGVTANGTLNGNINTGTSFVVQTLVTTQSGTGYFAFSGTAATQFFSNVTIDLAATPGPLFGNADFGTFSLQSIAEETSGANFRSFLVIGDYVGGTLGGPVVPSPAPAEFRITFNQSGGEGGTISSNATMAFVAVPEPSTMALIGIGGLAIAARLVQRRRSAMDGLTSGPRCRDWHRGEIARRCR
jgi:hypothetical protein